MMLWQGQIFSITGHLWGESTSRVDSPYKGPVMWNLDVFFDVNLNNLFIKQSNCQGFEIPSFNGSCDVTVIISFSIHWRVESQCHPICLQQYTGVTLDPHHWLYHSPILAIVQLNLHVSHLPWVSYRAEVILAIKQLPDQRSLEYFNEKFIA